MPDEKREVTEAIAEAVNESDGQVEFTWVWSKGSYWGKHMPEGLQVSVPWWAVVGGGVVAGATALGLLLQQLGKLDKYKPSKSQKGEYGPDRVTLADIDYARAELGPIITPMEWVVGVPMYARAHRDYRMEMAAEVAAPNDAGVPDTMQAAPKFTLFTLSSGEAYIRVYDGKSIVEYWLLNDGTQNSVETTAGTKGNALYTQAKREGLWPPRKLTDEERAEGKAYQASLTA